MDGTSVAAVRDGLTGWLDANSEEVLRAYGAVLQDPALTALFADEAGEITDTMKNTVEIVAIEAKKAFES